MQLNNGNHLTALRVEADAKDERGCYISCCMFDLGLG